MILFISILSLISTFIPTAKCANTKRRAKKISYKVLGEIPFDKNSFTQGLTYGNGKLYLSTGLYGHSNVREISKTDGSSKDNIQLSNDYFGEGLAFYKDKLIQLTWKEQKGFIYKTKPKLQLLKSFDFTTTKNEGWGITYHPAKSQFIVSDGSQYLHFWDETTLQETHKIPVTNYKGRVIQNINELEYFDEDHILANVWFKDKICLININTGKVEQEFDFTDLWPKSVRDEGADVFNGISAFDDGEFVVTGKLWPKMYRVKFDTIWE